MDLKEFLDMKIGDAIEAFISSSFLTKVSEENMGIKEIAKYLGKSESTIRHEKWLLPRWGQKRDGESVYKCSLKELSEHSSIPLQERKRSYMCWASDKDFGERK